MKQTLTNFFIATSIFMLSCTSCKKDTTPEADNPYGLPNATQTGANIFAYLIDGKSQIVKNSIYTLGASIIKDTLAISGESGDTNYFENIGLVIVGNLTVGSSYQINQSSTFIQMSTNKNCKGFLGSNIIKTFAVQGTILLSKVDLNNKVISGTFNCNIPSSGCDTIRITNGRFDIKYN